MKFKLLLLMGCFISRYIVSMHNSYNNSLLSMAKSSIVADYLCTSEINQDQALRRATISIYNIVQAINRDQSNNTHFYTAYIASYVILDNICHIDQSFSERRLR